MRDAAVYFAQQIRREIFTEKDVIATRVLPEVLYFNDSEDSLSDQVLDLYHFAELMKTYSQSALVRQAAQSLMDKIVDYVPFKDHSIAGRDPVWCLFGNCPKYENSHGVSVFFTKHARSFYSQGYMLFCDGTIWSPGLLASAVDDGGGWGSMIVDYVRLTNPNEPDDPNPPNLVAPQTIFRSYLPVVLRQ